MANTYTRAMRRYLALFAALSLMVGSIWCLSGCRRGSTGFPESDLSGRITITGSTALMPLSRVAGELFMERHPGVTVDVGGGGSFTGLEQVATGAADIGASDVAAPPEYLKRGLVDHVVAVAPFVIVVHPSVKVDNLSWEQLSAIFTGAVVNWKDVGGADENITIVNRPKASGSRAIIEEKVLGGAQFTNRATIQDSNGRVRAAVASIPGAIGYLDAAYLDQTVKAIRYNGIEYSPERVISGDYPLFAYEHMYTKGEPGEVTRAFLELILSAEFQDEYVAALRFIPVTQMSTTKERGFESFAAEKRTGENPR